MTSQVGLGCRARLLTVLDLFIIGPLSGLYEDSFESVLFGWQDSEVSAFCCTRGTFLVNNSNPTPRNPSITARPTLAEKERFGQLSASSGISESALALIAIRALLESNRPLTDATTSGTRREPATDRITVRLRPGDGRAISQRAARRGMRASTYLAALVRAHVAANPPLTVDEIETLKQGVVLLGKLGQSLSHISRNAAQGGAVSPELQTRLTQTHAVVAALERRTRDVARSALVTWESRFD